ncbi:Asp-tRNA(Asn)/Glu-tRNA(Gln) amidotransferase A subunit family amidase [Arthrobacter agilis]|nr:Asp-tRNA(Asn)/Glu-tRNA(Gln) amidotransferase A subunit family amidase [Arthrobacter agilis]
MAVVPPRSLAEVRENSGAGSGTRLSPVSASVEIARDAMRDLRAMTCVVEGLGASEEEADAEPALTDQFHGPLHGVPVVVKDSFHVVGLPRWHGSAIHSGSLSRFDSAPVARLREAGAVIVGKTAMSELGLIASGNSSQFGDTLNPWNTAMSPGGSSSGTAAAIAYGVTPVGLGTDIAGSVRLPGCTVWHRRLQTDAGHRPLCPCQQLAFGRSDGHDRRRRTRDLRRRLPP